jgi:predicted metal-dependent peptidase
MPSPPKTGPQSETLDRKLNLRIEAPDHHQLGHEAREAVELAAEIIRYSRNTLLINLRFLENALMLLTPKRGIVTSKLATDGQMLHYDFIHVCRSFQKGPQIPARDLLHVVLHCLFRHLFVGPKVEASCWDLACDVAVENVINNLGLKRLHCGREDRQKNLLDDLSGQLPRLTAERIYRQLIDERVDPDECERLREPFLADDHFLWRSPAGQAPSPKDQALEEGQDDNNNDDNTGDSQASGPDEEEKSQPPLDGSPPGEGQQAREQGAELTVDGDDGALSGGEGGEKEEGPRALAPEELEKLWRDLAERVEVDLETFSKSWGQSAGDLIQLLKEINREKTDYATLLKRFAVLGENVEVNDEEFDHIFYTYGLKLYGRMPLVEPLEYKETKKVREFVIALDTSESVAGDQVQAFVTKTWNILNETGSFFSKVNVHILQCGARVEEDAKITCREEFEAYIAKMVLRGFGGTDYRPVFEHVNNLIRLKELINLKGLIYFTDGYGTYPASPPAYDTVFVFLDQGRDIPPVPIWAVRLLLTDDDLTYF